MKTMMRHSLWRSLVFLAMLLLLASRSIMAAEFLDPEKAYRVSAELGRDGKVSLHWQIAKGYKLYRDRIEVSVESGNAKIGSVTLPKGIDFTDPSTGEKMEIYHDHLTASVPVTKATASFRLAVRYQGCAEDGLCYPPIDKVFNVDPSKSGKLNFAGVAGKESQAPPAAVTDPQASAAATPSEVASAATSAAASPTPAAASPANAALVKPAATGDDLSLAKATLESGSLWKVSLAFIVFGLLLSFTPCVLPMVPILSSIIVGEGETTRTKSFLMAVSYCLGMALVYTSLGVAAGLAGEGLAGALQKPWVLVMFALLLIGLSLSMFDVYQLQVPAALQNRLNQTSGKLKGGRFAGVFFMGSISALIVGPCVAAPLAGTLVYISQTKEVLIGGIALFSMAMGMSVPLLLIGLSAGSLLPKAGAWMIGVKYVFGLMLIAVAIWMATPVLPSQAVLIAWGALAIFAALFTGVFSAMPDKPGIGTKFIRALGLLLLLTGAMEVVGAGSGATSPLTPLSGIRAATGELPAADGAKLSFRRIRTTEELDRELKSATKPVMLDFYADWCVACKEMEHLTFSDPKVRTKLSGMTLLQVDVTANSEDDRKLMKQFGLFGPPGIVFFDKGGQEKSGSRIVGFVEAAPFLKHLENLL